MTSSAGDRRLGVLVLVGVSTAEPTGRSQHTPVQLCGDICTLGGVVIPWGHGSWGSEKQLSMYPSCSPTLNRVSEQGPRLPGQPYCQGRLAHARCPEDKVGHRPRRGVPHIPVQSPVPLSKYGDPALPPQPCSPLPPSSTGTSPAAQSIQAPPGAPHKQAGQAGDSRGGAKQLPPGGGLGSEPKGGGARAGKQLHFPPQPTGGGHRPRPRPPSWNSSLPKVPHARPLPHRRQHLPPLGCPPQSQGSQSRRKPSPW